MCAPSRPALPIVFITSRSRSASVMSSIDSPRACFSFLNSSISRAATFRKSSDSASFQLVELHPLPLVTVTG
jgi:hypothetical protein